MVSESEFSYFSKQSTHVVKLFTESGIISGKIVKGSQEIVIIWQNLDGE